MPLQDRIHAMMLQSAGYFNVQASLCQHYSGDLVENHNDSNLNWEFSVCTRIQNNFMINVFSSHFIGSQYLQRYVISLLLFMRYNHICSCAALYFKLLTIIYIVDKHSLVNDNPSPRPTTKTTPKGSDRHCKLAKICHKYRSSSSLVVELTSLSTSLDASLC